jgi:hypothetical protein
VRSCFCFLCGFTSLFLGPFAFIIFALRRLLRQGVCDRTFFLCDVTSLVFVHFSSFFLLLCPCSCQGVSDFASLFSSCFLFLFLFASSPLSLLRQVVCDLTFFCCCDFTSLSVSFCFFASVVSEASSRVREREYTCMHICTRTRVLYTLLVHTYTQGIAKLKNLLCTIKNVSFFPCFLAHRALQNSRTSRAP